jgi:glycosyltransferase involved in cell wall biosynthesis
VKIAFVTLGYRPFRTSGLDVSGERLVEGLLRGDHRVTVIAGSRGRVEETHCHPALNILRIALGPSDWIGFGYQAAKTLNRSGTFDVVHFWDVHFAWAYPQNYVASLQHSFRQRLNSIGGFSASPAWLKRFSYYTAARYIAELPAIRRARGLIAGSSATRDEFIANYPVDPERVVVARHGVDTNFFRPRSEGAKVRQSLGIGPDEPVILFVGFVTPRKGLEHLVEALPLIKPTPKLVLAGLWRNQAYRRRIMQRLGAGKGQVIEAGFVSDELMPAYYSMADVYVSSTLLEGFGLPIAEAMACETPVVTSEAGSTAEVLGPGGIVVPARDPRSLAAAVSSLLQDEILRKEMGSRGREHIVAEFSLERMVQDMLAAYKRL